MSQTVPPFVVAAPARISAPPRSAAPTPVATRVPLGIPAATHSTLDALQLEIAGIAVHVLDESGALGIIAEAGRRHPAAPLAIASVNLDHIHHFGRRNGARAGTTPRHATVPTGGGVRWLNLIDGAPIAQQVRRRTGAPHPRLAGSDLIGGVLDDAAAGGLTVAVLGGAPELRDALTRRLRERWPSLRYAGHWTPAREELDSPDRCVAIAAEIRETGADIVVVCLGKPRQEDWIDAYGVATGAGALLAFGAVVDFLAGRVSRAPRWVSAAGMEWMWRLMLEPRRLARRYLIEGPAAYVAVRRSSAHPRRA
ncbi:WecB/TagA/CpsF family glycosyltransferase [Microbacterium sp. 18062]|uniref:WecB/TagA/CpsF family glycosyltransferase n=1 Tax=Microbacterium sp. 18062 TaxID=2681410 RepID=UPI001359EE5E|nr:WecB/TagA/CpsF family glycosyltransferase [Microbacterium sp. 18062]